MSDSKQVPESELFAAIKELLKNNGYLNKLTAEMRAKLTEILQEKQSIGVRKSSPPTPTEEVLLVNELVREYLEWNGYLYTTSVLASEAAMPSNKKTRTELCSEVGVRDDEKSSSLPLLSNIVAAYTERIKRKLNKNKNDLS